MYVLYMHVTFIFTFTSVKALLACVMELGLASLNFDLLGQVMLKSTSSNVFSNDGGRQRCL